MIAALADCAGDSDGEGDPSNLSVKEEMDGQGGPLGNVRRQPTRQVASVRILHAFLLLRGSYGVLLKLLLAPGAVDQSGQSQDPTDGDC